MKRHLILNHWSDWLEPGSQNDSRLLHSDLSDRILVCPSHRGQGYVQEIPLRDDMSIFVLDYTLTDDLIIDASGESDRIEFAFPLTGRGTQYSVFCPYFGFRQFGVKRSQRRVFKVEIFFKQSTLISYFQAYMERLSPHARSIGKRLIQTMYRYQHGSSPSTLVRMLSQVMKHRIVDGPCATYAHVLPNAPYLEALILSYANRIPMTSAMHQVIGKILSCPYQGKNRRIYLECQALELVSLRLAAMEQPRLGEADLNSVHHAASILRNQLSTPPSVEALARQVCTNRLKLNQGFRKVYGTTPYGYLRDCRLWQAHRLLTISDLPIADIAASVGYTNRSHFALAFRQAMGLNPKAFQLQAWQWAS